MEAKKEMPDLREIFLREFTLSLIRNSFSEVEIVLPQPVRRIGERPPKTKLTKPVKTPPPIMRMPPPPKQKPQLLTIGSPEKKEKTPPQANILGLSSLTPILNDPAVLSIECPGPSKQVIVNKSGMLQLAPITLSKEEIEKVLEEVSEKTRIPIISGVFKAAFNNLIMTAVISEVVGSRFVIQKKSPARMPTPFRQ